MSQEDILRVIRKRKKWTCLNDVLPSLNINKISAGNNFKQLDKFSSFYGLEVKKGKQNKRFLRFKL